MSGQQGRQAGTACCSTTLQQERTFRDASKWPSTSSLCARAAWICSRARARPTVRAVMGVAMRASSPSCRVERVEWSEEKSVGSQLAARSTDASLDASALPCQPAPAPARPPGLAGSPPPWWRRPAAAGRLAAGPRLRPPKRWPSVGVGRRRRERRRCPGVSRLAAGLLPGATRRRWCVSERWRVAARKGEAVPVLKRSLAGPRRELLLAGGRLWCALAQDLADAGLQQRTNDCG